MTELHVIADVAALQGENRERGISRYVSSLLAEFLTDDRVILSCWYRPGLRALSIGSPLDEVLYDDEQIVNRLYTFGSEKTCFLWSSPFEWGLRPEEVLPPWLESYRIPLVAIGFDLIPLVFPDRYLADKHLESRYLARLHLLETSDKLLTISDSTSSDFLKFSRINRERIVKIGAGVDESTFRINSRVITSEVQGTASRRSVICVGGDDWRKNIELLIESWALIDHNLRARLTLKIICSVSPETLSRWESVRSWANLEEEDVQFLGHLSDFELTQEYSTASLAIAPYIYEGFGLPVAEAISMDVPVIVSNVSSLPEILEFPESTFDPLDPKSIASKVTQFFSDEDFRLRMHQKLRERADVFRWNEVARRALRQLEDVARIPAMLPKRDEGVTLAVIGPTEPSLSGVAVYTDKFLDAIAGTVHATVFRDDCADPLPGEPAHYSYSALMASRMLRERPNHEILAIIGNSDYHRESYRYAISNKCHVWLHDLTLTGLAVTFLRSIPTVKARVEWLQRIFALSGFEAPSFELLSAHHADESFFRALGFRFIEPLLVRAKSVIVNSCLARDIVLRTRLVDHDRVVVVPLGVEMINPAEKLPGKWNLVSAGWVSPTKRPEVLIECLCYLPSEATMTFLGPVTKAFQSELTSLAIELGVSNRVVFTGAVSRDQYEEVCARSSVGVQLRKSGNTESSATVMDLLAAGTPVVTDVATARELPVDALIHLRPSAGAQEIAGRILDLVSDTQVYREIARHGREFALTRSFGTVSQDVLNHIFGT